MPLVLEECTSRSDEKGSLNWERKMVFTCIGHLCLGIYACRLHNIVLANKEWLVTPRMNTSTKFMSELRWRDLEKILASLGSKFVFLAYLFELL